MTNTTPSAEAQSEAGEQGTPTLAECVERLERTLREDAPAADDPDMPYFMAILSHLRAQAAPVGDNGDAWRACADKAVEGIVRDLEGRRGLSDEWDQIDRDIQDDIKTGWRGIITLHMEEPASPPHAPSAGALDARALSDIAYLCETKGYDFQPYSDERKMWFDRARAITGWSAPPSSQCAEVGLREADELLFVLATSMRAAIVWPDSTKLRNALASAEAYIVQQALAARLSSNAKGT